MTNIRKIKIDGYNFGDRLLEGVEFEATIDVKNKKVLTITSDNEYLNSLNKIKWLKECRFYVEDLIAQGEWRELDEIIFSDMPLPNRQVTRISVLSSNDFLNQFKGTK